MTPTPIITSEAVEATMRKMLGDQRYENYVKAQRERIREEAKEEAPPIYTVSKILKTPTEISWLVENFLAPGSLAVLAGQPGIGKSMLCLHLAVCVASGRDWLGRKVRQSPVLLFDFELGRRRLAERLRAIAAGLTIPLDELEKTPLHFVQWGGNVRNERTLRAWKAAVTLTEPGLIIFDSLIDVVGDADENNSVIMAEVMSYLGSFSNDHTATLAIHHTGKASGRYRGSSAIAAAVSNLFTLAATDKAGILSLRIDKAWDYEAFRLFVKTSWNGAYTAEVLDESEQVTELTPPQSFILEQIADRKVRVADVMSLNGGYSELTLRRAFF